MLHLLNLKTILLSIYLKYVQQSIQIQKLFLILKLMMKSVKDVVANYIRMVKQKLEFRNIYVVAVKLHFLQQLIQ